jgi:hypothetical protein
MSDVQKVELVYRELQDDVDQIVAVRIGDQRLEVWGDSKVHVEHEAGPGGIGAIVRVELIAGQVRYVAETDESGAGG